MNVFILISLIIFFAMNMGASGVAPSFAAVFGAKFISRNRAILLFSVFVIIGAVFLGQNVSVTLGKGLMPREYMNFRTVLVILGSAAITLFIANILKIPQSTSQVTVGAIVGAGLFFKHLFLKTLLFKILPAWILLPLSSYFFTLILYRLVYPPADNNLHIYEKLFTHEKKLRISSIAVSCYVAFAIGSNNVANAVGPLYGAGIINVFPGLLFIAPLFGLGALVMGKGNLRTAGTGFIPLGQISSTLVSFVTATHLLVASFMGIPQSLVQLNIASIFAISCLKDGHGYSFDKHIAKKTFIVWIITPLLSVLISYLLLLLFAR